MFVTNRTATASSSYAAVLGATGVNQFAWSTSCEIDWSLIDTNTTAVRDVAACDAACVAPARVCPHSVPFLFICMFHSLLYCLLDSRP